MYKAGLRLTAASGVNEAGWRGILQGGVAGPLQGAGGGRVAGSVEGTRPRPDPHRPLQCGAGGFACCGFFFVRSEWTEL